MLNKIFEGCYENLFNKWVIRKIAREEESKNFLLNVNTNVCISDMRLDNELSNFNTFLQNNKEKYNEEFKEIFDKDVLFSFIKYIYNKNNMSLFFETNEELYCITYFNNFFEGLIEDNFSNKENKKEIKFNKSYSNEELEESLIYNSDITIELPYCFDRFFNSHIYESTNLLFTDYMLYAYFIGEVSFNISMDLYKEFFKTEDKSITEKYERHQLYYSAILFDCVEEYKKDITQPKGYLMDYFKDLTYYEPNGSFEEMFEKFIRDIEDKVAGLICSFNGFYGMDFINDIYSPYTQYFQDDFYKYEEKHNLNN